MEGFYPVVTCLTDHGDCSNASCILENSPDVEIEATGFEVGHHWYKINFSSIKPYGTNFLQSRLECYVKCYCGSSFDMICLKDVVKACCSSFSKVNYNEPDYCFNDCNANLIAAMIDHHDPWKNNCQTVQCVFIGCWNVVFKCDFGSCHYVLLSEKPAKGESVVGVCDATLTTTNHIIGQCDCNDRFSIECFSNIMRNFCKL